MAGRSPCSGLAGWRSGPRGRSAPSGRCGGSRERRAWPTTCPCWRAPSCSRRRGWSAGSRCCRAGPWLWIGTALVAAGLGFAVAARAYLGRNWSGTVTLKQGHELIRTGPYRLVRHPIYTGMLLAFVGTAMARGRVRGLVALAARRPYRSCSSCGWRSGSWPSSSRRTIRATRHGRLRWFRGCLRPGNLTLHSRHGFASGIVAQEKETFR